MIHFLQRYPTDLSMDGVSELSAAPVVHAAQRDEFEVAGNNKRRLGPQGLVKGVDQVPRISAVVLAGYIGWT